LVLNATLVLELRPNVRDEDPSESKFLAFPSRTWILQDIENDQRLNCLLIKQAAAPSVK
jgi:hypothetical protein